MQGHIDCCTCWGVCQGIIQYQFFCQNCMKDAVDYKVALRNRSYFFFIASRSEKPRKARKIVSKRLNVSSFI